MPRPQTHSDLSISNSINLGASQPKPVSLPKVSRLLLAIYVARSIELGKLGEIARELGYVSPRELSTDLRLLKLLRLVEDDGRVLRIASRGVEEIEKRLRKSDLWRHELEDIRSRTRLLTSIANEMGLIRFKECLHDSQCFEELKVVVNEAAGPRPID